MTQQFDFLDYTRETSISAQKICCIIVYNAKQNQKHFKCPSVGEWYDYYVSL